REPAATARRGRGRAAGGTGRGAVAVARGRTAPGRGAGRAARWASPTRRSRGRRAAGTSSERKDQHCGESFEHGLASERPAGNGGAIIVTPLTRRKFSTLKKEAT